MQACVTGATGCVGRNLVEELLSQGWQVIALHRRTSDLSRLSGLSIQTREVDLSQVSSVRQALPERVDAVFHCAASVSHWPPDRRQQWQDNVVATENVATAALERRAGRLIYTSTGAVRAYQTPSGRGSQYVASKYWAERRLLDKVGYGLDAVTLQPAVVIGPYDWSNYSQLFCQVKAGKMRWALPGSFVFCHARDVARAHVSAFHRGQAGQQYLLGGPDATWLDVLGKISRLTGGPPPRGAMPAGLLLAASHLSLWRSWWTGRKPLLTPQLVRLLTGCQERPSPEELLKAERDLGYRSASLDQMLHDCYCWLIREGMLNGGTR